MAVVGEVWAFVAVDVGSPNAGMVEIMELHRRTPRPRAAHSKNSLPVRLLDRTTRPYCSASSCSVAALPETRPRGEVELNQGQASDCGVRKISHSTDAWDRSVLSGIAGTNPVILFAPCFVLADGAGTALALFLWSVESLRRVARHPYRSAVCRDSRRPVGISSASKPNTRTSSGCASSSAPESDWQPSKHHHVNSFYL